MHGMMVQVKRNLFRRNLRDFIALCSASLDGRPRHGGNALDNESSSDDGKLHVGCIKGP